MNYVTGIFDVQREVLRVKKIKDMWIRYYTEYIEYEYGESEHGTNREMPVIVSKSEVKQFKYLGCKLRKDGVYKEDMKYRIMCEYTKWRE